MSSTKISEKSGKKQSRKEKEQLAMNAKLYDLEKQEVLARKKLADEEELEKGKRMFLCSGESMGRQSGNLLFISFSGGSGDYFRHRVALLRQRFGVF